MTRDVETTIEDLEFLDSTLVGAVEAAKRVDFDSPHALEKWLERHDQGIACPSRGVIPAAIREAFEAATAERAS